jgi:hypothetical protein
MGMHTMGVHCLGVHGVGVPNIACLDTPVLQQYKIMFAWQFLRKGPFYLLTYMSLKGFYIK